ncbi:siphovirus ReqiPepy6 Gp37-like family protein, partial [Thermoactinomyces intermedius]
MADTMFTWKHRIGGCDMKPEYRIRIRDYNLKFIWEITDFISLQYTLRMNALGKWILTLPYHSESTRQLLGLLTSGNKGVGGIYVERNGKYLFSGPLLDHEYTLDENGELMTFIGGDEMDFVARSLALAHPRIFRSPYMTDSAGNHTDYTPNDRGQRPEEPSRSSSECFWDIFGKNKAQDADPSRRIPQLYVKFTQGSANDVGSERYPSGDLATFPNPNPIVTRGDPMMDILEQIVNYSESTVYNSDGTVWKPPHPIVLVSKMEYDASIGNTFNGGWWITFEFKACPDKTRSIIFSKDEGNVLRIRRTRTAPEANIIQIGGSGDGADRVFAHSGDEPSRAVYGDREGFRSFSGFKRSTTDTTHTEEIEALKAQLYDELRKATSQTIIEADVIDKEGMRYHADWFLGDRVRVQTPLGNDDVIIREISGALDERGESVQVRLGTAPAPLYGLNDQKKTASHGGWIQNLFKRTQGE